MKPSSRSFFHCICLASFLALLAFRSAAQPDLRGFNRPYAFAVQQSSANWGDSINVQFSVLDVSPSPAGPFNIGLFLSADNNITTNDYRFGTVPASGVSSLGEVYFTYGSGSFSLPFINPLPGQPTQVYIGMIVDVDNQVAERNESNNQNLGNGVDRQDTPLTITPPPPKLMISTASGASPPALNFGNVANDGPGHAVGSQTITLVNLGKATLYVSNIVVTGSSAFTITQIASSLQSFISLANLPLPIDAYGYESWVITVQFDPVANNAASAALQIISDDLTTPSFTIPLSGTGVPVPQITLASATNAITDFGTEIADGPGGYQMTKTISFQNSGSGTLTVNQNGISLLIGSNYKILSITSSIRGALNLATAAGTIAPGGVETWSVMVSFDPASVGAASDGLQVISNDPNRPTFIASLQGTAISPMQLHVLDSTASSNIVSLAFPAVDADGRGGQLAGATILLRNYGQAPLTVAQNGLVLSNGVNFIVQSIVSDSNGPINLAVGPASLAPGKGETWTLSLAFDPTNSGSLADTLIIQSNDPTNPVVRVPLAGLALSQPHLVIADLVAPTNDLAVPFGLVLNDGPGGTSANQSLTLVNIGNQPLVFPQNGLGLTGNPDFHLGTIISSTRGLIDLSSASQSSRTLSANHTEIWTVPLAYDPTTNGAGSATLEIFSNDPNNPQPQVTLTGTGAMPFIALSSPSIPLNVSAGSVFNFTWSNSAPDSSAMISLYLDTDTNPANGLIPIATAIPSSAANNQFSWQVDPSLIGTNYTVYAAITDGSVTAGAYAAGRVRIEPVGAFQLQSSTVVTSPNYAYQYIYNGQLYQGLSQLSSGQNTVTVSNAATGGGYSTFQFSVNMVSSLTQAQSQKLNSLNQVVQTTNGNGIVTTFNYDALGRLIKRYSSNGALVTYTYNVLGQRNSMTDYTGTTTYEYDDLGRKISVTTSNRFNVQTLRYRYDLAGNRTGITYPDGENIQYSYEASGKLISVTNVTRGLGFNYNYNPANGLLSNFTRPNGVKTLYSYDNVGRLISLRHVRADGSLIVDYSYGLDAAGKATNYLTTLPSGQQQQEAYCYDATFDRLVQVKYATNGLIDANSEVVTYAYDDNGNRLSTSTSQSNKVTQVLTYAYGNDNRLLRVTDQNNVAQARYVYDSAGNRILEITPEKTTLYAYDERNLLTSVSDDVKQIVYTYNGDGQRTSKMFNGVLTAYVNDANRENFETIEELDAGGNQICSYMFGTTKVASLGDGTASFDLNDRLGSVRMLTDPLGAICASYAYDAFGSVISSSGVSSNYGFDGERFDSEVGLMFLRARYYSPNLGAFITRDPLGMQSGPNSYSFGLSDPVNSTDPSGKWYWLVTGAIGGAVGAVVGEVGGAIVAASKPNSDLTSILEGARTGFVGGGISGFAIGSGAALIELAGLGGAATFGLNATVGVAGNVGGAYAKNTYANYLDGKAWSSENTHDLYVSGALGAAFSPFQSIASIAKVEYQGALSDYSVVALTPGSSTFLKNIAINNIDAAQQLSDVTSSLNTFVSPLAQESINDSVSIANLSTDLSVGGVLIDLAAQLVGTSLTEFRGATYDPASGQFVFLGTSGKEAVAQLNLDYLFSALQAVYGSAVPPFVTLDPPASAYTQWTDYGNGDGIFEPGETGGFTLRYNPIWRNEDTTVDVDIKAQWSGTSYEWKARFDCLAIPNIDFNGHPMQMVFNSWVLPPPAGISLDKSFWELGNLTGSFSFNNDSQDSLIPFTLYNGTSGNFLINSVSVIPARQHRKYGGRVEGTKLGWVMLEADRVMKCLSVGIDNLTGAAYNSGTIAVPGYKNMAERLHDSGKPGGSIRFWFTPNNFTLMQDIDPTTGRATVVFSSASVLLNTESFVLGLPEPPDAKAFADQFTANYGAFAALKFPCVDPNDPTGHNIIQAPIFKMLQDVMKAVSLARFCRDNAIPVDTWWLNSWTPPVAYSPKSTPTAYDLTSGVLVYGGVQIYTPNAYVPSASAKDIAEAVQSSRIAASTNAAADLQQQVWSANTAMGALTAVSANTSAEPQDGNIRLAERDLSFASPGALPFQFGRYYQSSWLGNQKMGAGWRYTPFVMEFQRPSWFDENSLMVDTNGFGIWKDDNYDTRLRSGAIRVVDLRSGATLDFNSSLVLGYAVNSIGNPIISVSGLDANDLPVFTPGLRQSGGSLIQLFGDLSYLFTSADGAQIAFDSNGRLLSSEDRYHMVQTYNYDANGVLTNITDSAGQMFSLVYDPQTNVVTGVNGPANEQIQYAYSNNCLITATHLRSGASVTYLYNTNRQMTAKIPYNGIAAIQLQPDLKGRPNSATDTRGNTRQKGYMQNTNGSVRVTQTIDPMITDPSVVPWQKQFDRSGRILSSQDATGATTQFGYLSNSLAPNQVQLPIAGRPAIAIQRNQFGRPTRISDPGNIGAQDLTAVYDTNTAQLTHFSDAMGRTNQLMYDRNGSIARIHRTHGNQNADVNYSYYPTGALRAKTNELGQTVATYYRDAMDRVTNAVNGTGISVGYEYDSLGRLSRIRHPSLSGPIQYSYDNFDRMTQIQSPAGSVYYAYDSVKGWLVSRTDILGRTNLLVRDEQTGDILQSVDVIPGGTNRVTQMTYNRFGQLASVTSPDAHTITYAYDALGRALGSSSVDALPPGPPKVLQSNHAFNGVPTSATNHLFTWGAPDSDSGVAGYSYAFDSVPISATNTAAATASWGSVSIGAHTFQVKALGNNGLWGPVAVFNLIVADLAASPSLLSFGGVTIGHTNTATLILTNLGSQMLTGTASANSPFLIASGTPFAVQPGNFATVTVGFAPATTGNFSNAVLFTTSVGTSSAGVTGTGLTPPALAVTPGNFDFGLVLTGATAQTTFSVSNSGGSQLVATMSATPPFAIVGSTNIVVPGYTVSNVFLSFTPSSTGFYTTNLIFQSNGGNATNSINGRGAMAPMASFTASPTFGEAPLAVTFTDKSSGPITNELWSFGDGTFTNGINARVAHTYVNAGAYTVTLTASGTVGAPSTNQQMNIIVVTNSQPPALRVGQVSLNFGAVRVGQPYTLSIGITNGGGQVLTGSAVGAGSFQVGGSGAFAIPSGASGSINVTFLPTNTGSFSNLVVFTSNGGTFTNTSFGQGALAPSASFTVSSTAGFAPLNVAFSDTSSGTITNRMWFFGDGAITNVNATNLTHAYTSVGTNLVSLVVSGPVGIATNAQSIMIAVANIVGSANCSYVWTNFAGQPGGAGNSGGLGAGARFAGPNGVAIDNAGNVYIADTGNSAIRKMSPTGQVSWFAGSPGIIGTNDGVGQQARFDTPEGIAIDGAGNLYVVDTGNSTVRKVTPSGFVTTLAGDASTAGSSDGIGSAATFYRPTGAAVDAAGNIFVSDSIYGTIRKITASGVVTTYAGTPWNNGTADGTGSSAQFGTPRGLAVDKLGNLYVADSGNNTIRKITPSRVVTTLAGLGPQAGTNDGTGSGARFNYPAGICLDTSGNLFVADSENNIIRMVTPGGVVSTLAGDPNNAGSADGNRGSAQFAYPAAVAIDGTGSIVVADTGNSTIRKITQAGFVTTMAGSAPHSGSADGAGSIARFSVPEGVAIDAAGNVYVADNNNSTVRKITPAGIATTLAGSPGVFGSADGTGRSASFYLPNGLAVDSAQNVYVADTFNHTIRKISPGGVVTTFAGIAGNHGNIDGTVGAAEFSYPDAVALDTLGNVYVADNGNYAIRKIANGVVTTLAHVPGANALSVDSQGNIYVADSGDSIILKITPAGSVTNFAGSVGITGSADGIGTTAQFYNPAGLAVDVSGNVFVSDTVNNTIRKITPAGVVTTVGGSAGIIGGSDGLGGSAIFSSPEGIAISRAGTVYFADSFNNRLVRGTLQCLPTMITLNSLPSGTVGMFYSDVLVAGGGAAPYSWSVVSNTLPQGLVLAPNTGTLSGVPQVAVSSIFRLRVTGADGLFSEQDFSLAISASFPQLAISAGMLDFGPVKVGQTNTLTFGITNTGGQTLIGTAASDGAYQVLAGGAFVVSPGQSSNISISFTPGAKRDYLNVIVIASNGGNAVKSLLGTGAIAPNASFTAGPLSGAAPLAVTFVDTSSGTVANETWDFGDGATTNGLYSSVSHVYNVAGTYTISIVASGPLNPASTNQQLNLILVTNPPPPAILAVGPAHYNFGALAIGQTNTVGFIITNAGGEILTGVAIANGPFQILSGNPYTVPPGSTATVQMSFSPSAAGNYSNTVAFISNGGNVTNDVAGLGAVPPLANFVINEHMGQIPFTVGFMDTSTGTITNELWDFGDGTITNGVWSSFAHTYYRPGIYSVTLVASGPVGSPSTNHQFGAVVATNLPPPLLSVGTTTMDFGTVAVGQTNTLKLGVTNLGGQALTGTVSTLAPFYVSGGVPYNLAPGGTTIVSISFIPKMAGRFNGGITFSGNGGTFTNAVVGQSAVTPQAAFTVDKTYGTTPLSVTFNDNSTGTIDREAWDFGDGATLVGLYADVTHIYANPGTFTVTLIATGPVGQPSTNQQFNLIVVTNPVPVLTVGPPSIDFGGVPVGLTNSMSFAVTNAGDATLIGSASVSAPFAILSGTPYTLLAGQSGLVSISFNPGNVAFYSNAVIFMSNGGSSSNYISGQGLTPPLLSAELFGASVVLSWPTNYAGFILQSSTTVIAPRSWAPVVTTLSIVGNRFYVTNAASLRAGYFRLSN